jgi:hypothetical protein
MDGHPAHVSFTIANSFYNITLFILKLEVTDGNFISWKRLLDSGAIYVLQLWVPSFMLNGLKMDYTGPYLYVNSFFFT